MNNNPFHYGSPVSPDGFVGRDAALRLLRSRIHNGESSAIVGEPHSGKSSLLRYLFQSSTNSTLKVNPIIINCHDLPEQLTPIQLWSHFLQPLEHNSACSQPFQRAIEARYAISALKSLFASLSEHNQRVLLLLDEFDDLLHHPRVHTYEFWAGLRSLTSDSGGLVVVAASRYRVMEMIRLCRDIERGSPFFNGLVDVSLAPWQDYEVRELVGRKLTGNSVSFSDDDIRFLLLQGGGQPFLTQALAAALYDCNDTVAPGAPRHAHACIALHERTESYFGGVWRHLDGGARLAMLLLALLEAGADRAAASIQHSAVHRLCAAEWPRLLRRGFVREGGNDPESVGLAGGSWMLQARALRDWIVGGTLRRGYSETSLRQWLSIPTDVGEVQQVVEHAFSLAQRLPAGMVRHVSLLSRDSYDAWQNHSFMQSPCVPTNRPTPTTRELRLLLRSRFPTTPEFDAFCMDFFPSVYRGFTPGMDRTQRENRALESIPNLELISALEKYQNSNNEVA